MAKQLEDAKHRLFDAAGLRAADIKLFPGSNRDATADEMAEQINKALDQIERGDYDVIEEFDD